VSQRVISARYSNEISHRKSSPQAVRRRYGDRNESVRRMLDEMRPEDELRAFSSPRENVRHQTQGYVVLRAGEVVDRVIVRRRYFRQAPAADGDEPGLRYARRR